MTGETLFALASAPGRAAIAVWRLSGPGTADGIRLLTGKTPPAPRRASLRRLTDPATGEAIDQALVLWFPGPASFTGEDSAELHSHGGRAVAEAIGAALARLPGFRHAEPGEFSRRAFQNGKLDLTEAEAIADLAAAETEAQRRQALAQAGGALSGLYDGWRTELIRLRAHLEAEIEFPDEDVGDPVAQLSGQIGALSASVSEHLADARRGERLRDGLTIAVVGAPNAGKSSLVNALAQRDVAIVSPEAGTTRDAIEVHLDLGGYPVVLVDTAGLRRTAGAVETEGIRRARARAEAADLVLALLAADADRDAETLALLDERAVVVLSKADLQPRSSKIIASPLEGEVGPKGRVGGSAATSPTERGRDHHPPPAGQSAADLPLKGGGEEIAISTKTGQGIDILLQFLTVRVSGLLADRGAPPPTRARHREALTRCLAALDAALTAELPELAAEDLRRAAEELGRITGRIDIEDMLDAIFRDFCIGK
ncbi:MAG TPA: tRNA uridine-5-carboxymethylaminomethyl(34) synthesis GTPase MnmE [Alphaproteobacteria bacterium]|jgi:tRNA modification GTPase|nr:tRNA uridine-5-carboxymethylaminomethyl(34) synthesis GTPase MnmE [Alphaproteobacteria bacterium]